jgi:hypothetical protein
MSVPVELGELQQRLEEYGPFAFLVTVGDEGRPHVVSVSVALDGGVLNAGAGRTTSGNIAANPTVSLVWPARPGDDYCLIVDGAAEVAGETAAVDPTRAVLHRVAGAAGDGPSCITVL